MQLQLILLLINPLANKKVIAKTVAQITTALNERKIVFESFTESWPAEINIYKEVWLIGGDGTKLFFKFL